LLSMEATDAAEVLSERQCLAWWRNDGYG
jgi:hypothetical protein